MMQGWSQGSLKKAACQGSQQDAVHQHKARQAWSDGCLVFRQNNTSLKQARPATVCVLLVSCPRLANRLMLPCCKKPACLALALDMHAERPRIDLDAGLSSQQVGVKEALSSAPHKALQAN